MRSCDYTVGGEYEAGAEAKGVDRLSALTGSGPCSDGDLDEVMATMFVLLYTSNTREHSNTRSRKGHRGSYSVRERGAQQTASCNQRRRWQSFSFVFIQ